jgi:glutamyl-tRNA synthetase
MQAVPLKQKVALMLPYLQRAGLVASPPPCEVGPKLTRIVEAAGDRLKTLGDILAYAGFFFRQEVEFDPVALDKQLRKPGAAALLRRFAERLAGIEPFEPPQLEAALHAFVAEEKIKPGDIVHAVRVAVTGKSVGAGLYDCLAILGREACLTRIEKALTLCGPAA